MHVYRFKILFEEQDGFSRELDLLASQTFGDFHQAIQGDLGLNAAQPASFFICDHKFRKQQEIFQDDGPEGTGGAWPEGTPLMHACRLRDFIDDPHQKLIYLYDPLKQFTFYIELQRIIPSGTGNAYPRFHKKRGETPVELLPKPPLIVDPGIREGEDSFTQEEGIDPEDLQGLGNVGEAFPDAEDAPQEPEGPGDPGDSGNPEGF